MVICCHKLHWVKLKKAIRSKQGKGNVIEDWFGLQKRLLHRAQIRNLQRKALGEVLLRQYRLYLSSTYLFTRKESPPLPARYHVHPEVGAKSIDVKVAICACASNKETGPALMVEGSLRSLFEVVVL